MTSLIYRVYKCYIIGENTKDTLIVVGNGNGVRFVVDMPEGVLDRELVDLKTLGGRKVKCWNPGLLEGAHFYRFGPVDPKLSPDVLRKELGIFAADVQGIRRLKTKRGVISDTVMIALSVPRVKEISVSGVFYPLRPFYRNVLRCYKCLKFGHSTFTCGFRGNRCRRCCGVHGPDETIDVSGVCFLPANCILWGSASVLV